MLSRLVRYLHAGRSLSAIEASSPFDKIFFDFQKHKILRTSGFNLFVKEYQLKTKGGFILDGLTYHVSIILYSQPSKIILV